MQPLDVQPAAQLSNPSAAPSGSWMDSLEIVSVVVSLGSSVALAAMQQAALATIPLSFTAALNLANRKRLMNAMAQSQQAATAQLVSQATQHQQRLDDLTQSFETRSSSVTAQFTEMQTLSTEFKQQLQALEAKDTDIETVLEKLREIDRCTQAIRTNPKAADFFFQRGQVRQSLSRMEDNRIAIEDYTQAIKLEPTFAKAYFNRGFLRAELGEKRQAGEDLRMAAKCYFDQGQMDSYAEAKQLSEQVYANTEAPTDESTSLPGNEADPVAPKLLVSDLFS
ncbi:tetratricopeptide repeat protein [filamentous cyanobacterium LEGE 11480]|uniref:Tetratricopeptide repeat protein n=1 Tax=Romeriopsis navalis LEGE 11480 TaxID=2777977 RepID=A0A928VNK2_9CYAN|nr:tetratricopeptide repeat protein [Romeriopsis navalis]MBE9029996.1 tetratricopeptide repeat protein [Romeriopsis navalis LEGE 11480]